MEYLNDEKSFYEHIDVSYLRKVWDILIRSPELKSLIGKSMVIDGYDHTRYDHTFDVVDIAERIARAVRPSDEKFILMVKIAALVHDLGQGINHETELCSDNFLSEITSDAKYQNNRIEDFGEEYTEKTNGKDNMGFAHHEHSVRTINSILSIYELSTAPELISAILSHSSSSLTPPDALLDQIILISDKISYGISDIKNLEDSDIIDSEDIEQASINILLEDASDLKTHAIGEIVKEYEETGKVTGGYAEVKKYFGYVQKENISEEEKSEREQTLHKLENMFPVMTSLYKAQVKLIKPALTKKTNNKIKNEILIARFDALLRYFTTNPDDLKEILRKTKAKRKNNIKNGQLNRLTKWMGKYSLPEAVTFCLNSFEAKEIEDIYSEIEHLLPLKLEAKFNFLMNPNGSESEFNSIILQLKKDGFELIECSEDQSLEDYFYDTPNYHFREQKTMIRTRKKLNDESNVVYEGVVKKMYTTKANSLIHKVKEFKIDDTSLSSFAPKLTIDGIEDVEENPKLKMNTLRRNYSFKHGSELLTFSYDQSIAIDPSTSKKIRTINRLGITETTSKYARNCLHDILDTYINIQPTKKTLPELAYEALDASKSTEIEDNER